jgi:hypothetical protein
LLLFQDGAEGLLLLVVAMEVIVGHSMVLHQLLGLAV